MPKLSAEHGRPSNHQVRFFNLTIAGFTLAVKRSLSYLLLDKRDEDASEVENGENDERWLHACLENRIVFRRNLDPSHV